MSLTVNQSKRHPFSIESLLEDAPPSKKIKLNETSNVLKNTQEKVNDLNVDQLLKSSLVLSPGKENRGFSDLSLTVKKKSLVDAIQSNDIEKVRTLASKMNINCSIKGKSPLFYAIIQNNFELVKLFILGKAKVNDRCKLGFTPIMYAIDENNLDILKLLVSVGGNVNKLDGNGVSPLFHAITKGNLEIVKFLLLKEADVDYQAPNGKTLLIHAIETHNIPILDCLLQNDAEIHFKDSNGMTALLHACSANNFPAIKLLVEKGADVNCKDLNGMTPLLHAARANNMPAIELFVKKDADVNCKDSDEMTPLQYTIQHNNTAVIDYLVENGAEVEPLKYRSWPFLYAIFKEKPEAIKCFIRNKADINKFFFDTTPLVQARRTNNQEIIDLVLEMGADKECYQIIEKKFLANVWGIKGDSFWIDAKAQIHSFSLEGFCEKIGSLYFERIVKTFFEGSFDLDFKVPLILDAFKLRSDEEMVEKIEKNEPIVFSGGLENHLISFLIYDGILAIGNRGERSQEHSGVYLYKLSRKMTKEEIKNLKHLKKNLGEFDAMIKHLNLEDYHYLPFKEQKVGNCVFANWKIIFGALCYLLEMPEAQQLYKWFTAFSRDYSLKEYLKKYPSLEDEFIHKVLDKKRQKESSQIPFITLR